MVMPGAILSVVTPVSGPRIPTTLVASGPPPKSTCPDPSSVWVPAKSNPPSSSETVPSRVIPPTVIGVPFTINVCVATVSVPPSISIVAPAANERASAIAYPLTVTVPAPMVTASSGPGIGAVGSLELWSFQLPGSSHSPLPAPPVQTNGDRRTRPSRVSNVGRWRDLPCRKGARRRLASCFVCANCP